MGIILSIINFLFQIVNFQINGYGLSYCSGINLLLGIDQGFKFHIGLITSIFSSSINTDDKEFIFKLNIVAILIIWVLADIYDERFNKKVSMTEENINI